MSRETTTADSWDPTEAPAEVEQGFLAELWQFVWENKIWWMTPTFLILAGLVTVIMLSSESSIAPFFYALF